MTTSIVRFCDNDYSDFATISVTGSKTGYPYTNAANSLRSLVWIPPGSFVVTSSNNVIYINDGSDKTVTLTVGTYTYSTLATHVQTQLNASSSSWTCAYDFSGSTFKFTIGRGSSGTLRFTQTSNAAWDMLGFTLAADTSGTSFVAQEVRIHTMERYVWALPVAQIPTFFAAIGPIGDTFTVSESATCTLKCNNMPVWTSPAQTISLDVRDSGIHYFLDSDVTTAYNYFCFEVIDRTNPLGPEGLKFGRIWLGDDTTITSSNVATGYRKSLVDPSDVFESEIGTKYFNRRPKYRSFSSMEIQNLSATDRLSLEAMFDRLGVDQTFFFSMDSSLSISSNLDELTFYARFASEPSLAHLIRDYYTMSFEVVEAV